MCQRTAAGSDAEAGYYFGDANRHGVPELRVSFVADGRADASTHAVLARVLGDLRHAAGARVLRPCLLPLHQLTVDSYGASHPGKPERRATQATGLHLMTLQLFIERGIDASAGPKLHKRIVRHPPELRWLEPPSLRGRLTAADVLDATTAAEHLLLVRRWAEDIWAAWATHHATVRDWVRQSLQE